MRTYDSTYKDIRVCVIENDLLKAMFIPNLGAKLCSLINKTNGKEYLYQRGGSEYRRQSYDGNYLDGECSGVDDAFPTIDEYVYDRYPWKGIRIPDHGEVWALKWDHLREDNYLEFSISGVRLPYEIRKRVTLVGKYTLHIEYELKNKSAFPIDYIWAAHIMLNPEKGCRIKMPKNMQKAICVMSDSGTIGKYGDELSYPIVKNARGEYDFRIHRGSEANDYQKIYFQEPTDEGWSELEYPDGSKLRIEVPIKQVPYFAAIQGEGGSLGINSVFFEPCTGSFDRPDIARMRKQNSILKPFETIYWYLKFTIQ